MLECKCDKPWVKVSGLIIEYDGENIYTLVPPRENVSLEHC
jgi:hypothetical protein